MSTTAGTARVLAVTEYGRPLELIEVPLPELEHGAILVEMDVATICGSDVHQWSGAWAGVFDLPMPLCTGHEGVGRVLELGPGAEIDSVGVPLKVGDRLIWEHENCGHCYECTVLHDEVLCSNRRPGMQRSTNDFPFISATFGTHGYVWPKAGRLRVPDAVKSEWASAASCALRTVIPAVEKAGPIGSDDTIVIQGVGPLGLFATAVLSLYNPRRLITIGAPEARQALARDWGATDTIDIEEYPDPASRKEAVLALTDGRGPDKVFEFAGVSGAFAEALDLAARDGVCVVVGSAGGPAQPVFAHHVIHKQLTVRGSFSGRVGHYAKALDFMARHSDRFDWDRLFTGRYRLDQVSEALAAMQRGTEIKPVVMTQELA
jgi:L-iditol 2-dehydrogenase